MAHAILIVGMHRSGTSAMTRVCNLLGVELGGPLVPPGPFNPKGHWEHKELLRINRRMLRALGASSGFVHPLPMDQMNLQRLKPFEQMLDGVVGNDFRDVKLWGVKDPDTSRLVSVWLGVFSRQTITPRFILMVRHPYEVADSLRCRNEFPRDKSLLLWLRYSLESEYATRDYLRSIVIHKQLMVDWRVTVRQLEEDLQFQFPHRASVMSPGIDEFLDSSLYHFRRDPKYAANSAIGELALVGYQAFMLQNSVTRRAVLDELRGVINKADHRLARRQLFRKDMSGLEREMLAVYRAEKYKPVLNPVMKVARGLAAVALLLS